ncbi:MAG: FtsW/RodA/SpoVE family cell cycle protein, partial [Treponema sp.]|nr:FtsW/RodA/SpoVE family cell cycle protein [Treponema sp.]
MKIKDILEIDFLLIVLVMALTAIGILFIYSSGVTAGLQVSNEYIKQIIWAIVGMVLLAVIAFIDYRKTYDWSIYIYLGTLILL